MQKIIQNLAFGLLLLPSLLFGQALKITDYIHAGKRVYIEKDLFVEEQTNLNGLKVSGLTKLTGFTNVYSLCVEEQADFYKGILNWGKTHLSDTVRIGAKAFLYGGLSVEGAAKLDGPLEVKGLAKISTRNDDYGETNVLTLKNESADIHTNASIKLSSGTGRYVTLGAHFNYATPEIHLSTFVTEDPYISTPTSCFAIIPYGNDTSHQRDLKIRFGPETYTSWPVGYPPVYNSGSACIETGNKRVSFYPCLEGYLGEADKMWKYLYARYPVFESTPSILSDYRAKDNIEEISPSSLNKLCRLQPISYNMKAENTMQDGDIDQSMTKSARSLKNKTGKTYFGLVAQEVMQQFPEIVDYDSVLDRYSVRYMELIPILIESIKLQQEQINALMEQLGEGEYAMANRTMHKAAANVPAAPIDGAEQKTTAQLFQNTPNPFNQETAIKYYIPEHAGSSMLFVYDMSGKQLKKYTISTKGFASIVVKSSELKPGMYYYTLIVDGEEIASKKMIITD